MTLSEMHSLQQELEILDEQLRYEARLIEQYEGEIAGLERRKKAALELIELAAKATDNRVGLRRSGEEALAGVTERLAIVTRYRHGAESRHASYQRRQQAIDKDQLAQLQHQERLLQQARNRKPTESNALMQE